MMGGSGSRGCGAGTNTRSDPSAPASADVARFEESEYSESYSSSESEGPEYSSEYPSGPRVPSDPPSDPLPLASSGTSAEKGRIFCPKTWTRSPARTPRMWNARPTTATGGTRTRAGNRASGRVRPKDGGAFGALVT